LDYKASFNSEAANTLVTMFKLCTFDLAQFILQEVEGCSFYSAKLKTFLFALTIIIGDVEMAIEIFLEYYGFYELFAAEICLLYRRQLSR
jgi:hypothetical protein